MGKFIEFLARIVHPNTVRALVTYFLVSMAILAFLVAVFAFTDMEKAELIAGFFTGLLGVVLGYFFGERGANRAEKIADDATKTAKDALKGVGTNVQSAQKAVTAARRAAMLTPTAAEKLLVLAQTETSRNIRRRLIELSDEIEIEDDQRELVPGDDPQAIQKRLNAIRQTKSNWESTIDNALASITLIDGN